MLDIYFGFHLSHENQAKFISSLGDLYNYRIIEPEAETHPYKQKVAIRKIISDYNNTTKLNKNNKCCIITNSPFIINELNIIYLLSVFKERSKNNNYISKEFDSFLQGSFNVYENFPNVFFEETNNINLYEYNFAKREYEPTIIDNDRGFMFLRLQDLEFDNVKFTYLLTHKLQVSKNRG